jgi:hypothetical protein
VAPSYFRLAKLWCNNASREVRNAAKGGDRQRPVMSLPGLDSYNVIPGVTKPSRS